MSNVRMFPKTKRPIPVADIDVDKIKAAMPKGMSVLGVLSWVWFLVRLPLFLVLYWLRLPIVFICNLISVPALLAWLFTLYAIPDKPLMHWLIGGLSFAAFVVSWFYDYVLVALSPQDIMRTL